MPVNSFCTSVLFIVLWYYHAMKLVDITGQRFGRLAVICRNGLIGNAVAWLCKCDCGNESKHPGIALRSGHVKSCGCLKIDTLKSGTNTKHGMGRTPTYATWSGMKTRCYNTQNDAYKSYGERGITVCDRWLESFSAFLNDMGERPKGKSLDRINNDGPYSPENCRWATRTQQSNNTRRNVRILFNGREMTVSEWAKSLGVSREMLANRLSRGWPISRTFTEPADVSKRTKREKS